MKKALYEVIIWPLLAVGETAVFLISSPKSANNHVSQLMRKKTDDGQYIFYLCSVSDLCSDCLRQGEDDCLHQMATIPDHLTSKNGRMIEVLYDDKDMAEQEMKGNPLSSQELVFKPMLERFQRLPEHHFSNNVQIIYTFFDPSGGGDSFATIVSHTRGFDDERQQEVRVITGMDRCGRSETTLGMTEKFNMIRRHFAMHRADPRYCNAWFFIALEANMSTDMANDTGNQILELNDRRLVVVKAQKKQTDWFGVVTTNQEKRKWANHTTWLLHSNRLRMASNLIGAGALDELLPALIEEMGRYARTVERINEGELNERWVEMFSGKAGGKQDDFVTALIACLWEAEVLRQNEGGLFHKIVTRERLTFL